MSRRGFDRLAYRAPRPSPPIIHALGFLNRHVILPGVLRLRAIDFPAGDRARLRGVVHPGTAAFLAPNHPEFMTDWLIDKEISRVASPLMAHWASYEVVNIHPVAQWLWLRNNLIANAPGGDGRAYSVRWARAGHGVLLHPEGAPSWHGDRVGPLVPGVVAMAWETASALATEGGSMPVHVVPLVWKLHFTGDVGAALKREIRHVARALDLAEGPPGAPLEEAFAAVHEGALARSIDLHGGGVDAAPPARSGGFFARQAAHADRMLAALEARHGRSDGDTPRRVHGLRRAILASSRDDRDAARRDRRRLAEVERLLHFTAEHYGGATLTQEQIAESVKQLRLALLVSGPREAAHGILPVAVAPRIARIRVPEPLDVRAALDRGGDAAAGQAALLGNLRARMQGSLDALCAEIEPIVGPHRRVNPFLVSS